MMGNSSIRMIGLSSQIYQQKTKFHTLNSSKILYEQTSREQTSRGRHRLPPNVGHLTRDSYESKETANPSTQNTIEFPTPSVST